MEFNRARTRLRDHEVLMRRYREWKTGQTDSGSKGSSESSKFGVFEASSDSVNVKLGLTDNKSKKIEENRKGVNKNTDGVVKFDNVVASSDKRNMKSGLIGCKSRIIEKTKRRVKRNSDDFVKPYCDSRKKCKSSKRIGKSRNVDRISDSEDTSGDDLDVVHLKDDDREKEDQLAQPVVELKRGRKHFTSSSIGNCIAQMGVTDEKSEGIDRGVSSKGDVNPTKSKEFSKRDKKNKNVVEISDDDESDDVKIINISDGSRVPSICSNSGKQPSKVVSNCNVSQGNYVLASRSHKRGKSCILKNTDRKYFEDSNQDDEWMGVTKKGKDVNECASISSSSEELLESENTSCTDFTDSSESLYEGETESSSSDEEETTSVAERLRQRHRHKSTTIIKLKMDNNLMGNLSCPLTLSDDEMACLFEEEDVGHGDKTAKDEVRDNEKVFRKDTEMEIEVNTEVGRPTKNECSAPISVNNEKIIKMTSTTNEVSDSKKDVSKDTEKENEGRKKVRRPTKNTCSASISVKQILVDSIWEKGGSLLENLVPPKENPTDGVDTLPLKFSFDDEDMKLSEKFNVDVEAEQLFEEMAYATGILNVGSFEAATVDSEEKILSKNKKDPASGCLEGGNHHLVLDEQIGLRCTICYLVMQEIRDILPDFSKHQGGRAEARYFDGVDHSNFGAVQLEDVTASQVPAFKRRVQAEGTVWDLIPGIQNGMYPHQQEGFEFIWKNIAGSIFIEKAKKCTSDGGGLGCIISHAPGTGKTRLTIMFLQTYMLLNTDCLPLIIAPCSMLLTWEEEFRKWNVGIPFHNLNSTEYSGKESASAVNLLKNDRQHGNESASTRLVKLFSWKTEKSVLGISYQLFEELANINVLVDGGKKKVKGKDNEIAGQIRKMLLELPSLLVLDEGHIPRNGESQIWKALSEVQTKRRIMLSGTPFQNNFEELWNTFRIVRPKFFDDDISQTPGNGLQKRRIKRAKGKWDLMTNNIGENNDQKLEELKILISDFVHVYKGSILKEKLPGLRVSVVVLSPTTLQKDLTEAVHNRNFFKRQHLKSLISVHPALLSFDDLSGKEVLPVTRNELERLKLKPNEGVKTRFLTELIKLSWVLKERVLIFSQFIEPLKFIMNQLRDHFQWTKGKEILYMTGEHCEKERQSSINLLNDPESDVRVMLASSRACSEGINLVGASRVVLLDVVWNPSIKRQSISRAYRIGQEKVVHVYHLLAGAWECEKYRRQAGKDRISNLIFSPKDSAHKPESSSSVAEDKILQDMVQHESMSKIFVKILNQPKDSDLIDVFG